MILLKLGDVIKGDSQQANHTDWIAIASVSFGVGRSVTTSGLGKDRDTSTPSFGEVTLAKATDIASTQLFAQAIYGKKICDKAELHWIQTGGDGADQVFMTVELFEPIISSYSASSGGDRPSESFCVNFTKIIFKYTQFADGGTKVDADPKGYDLKTGKPAVS